MLDGSHASGSVYNLVVHYTLDNARVSETDFTNLTLFNAADKRCIEYEVNQYPSANQWPLFYFSDANSGLTGQITTPQPTQATYQFTVYGGNYYYQGVANPSPTLQKGKWYEFTLNDSSVSNHPMAFSLGSDGTHNGHAVYEDYRVVYLIDNQSVTFSTYTQQFSSASSRSVRILFPDVANINTVYYFCVNHPGMGSDIPIS